jgi:phospholipase/carboxylesterase
LDEQPADMTGESLPLTHVNEPPERTVDGRAPAVVVLHGRGADEQDLLPIAAQLPDELHVLSVRAPDRLQGGYTWYDLDLSGGGLHESQPDQRDFERSLRLVHEFVDAAVDAYDLDPDRVGLLGFSQGAITGLSALLERPDRYRWVVALNGYLAAEHEDHVDAAAGKPVFVGCGAMDQVIPPERAERAAERLRQGGAEVRFERYGVGHGTTPEEITDVVQWLEDEY